ncbi:MAG: hypothetical protein IT371_08655 [Deltaproteobacteria bacterium]|nr:hypothetical protein [Deltaproteobacteria bacterium]
MATACLLIGWNQPYPDRQDEAYKTVMREGLEKAAMWKKGGWFEGYEAIGLTPHGGTLGGFLLFKGERAKLDELRRTDEFERFSMRLARLFDGYRVVPGVTEEGLRKVAERNPEMFK